MSSFPLLKVSFILNLIAVLFVISCIILILIILIQKGKGGGLSSAFGGGMAGGLLGSKTGDFLTWVTIVLVGIVLLFAVFLAKYYKPSPEEAPGITTTMQTQPETTPSEELVSPNAPGQSNNKDNSMTTQPAVPVNENPVTPVENTNNTNVNTNQSGEVNKPDN